MEITSRNNNRAYDVLAELARIVVEEMEASLCHESFDEQSGSHDASM
jgi:hypothetical protein